MLMKALLKLILILLLLAIMGDCCKYVYKIATEPEPFRSDTPFFIS
jgi:hypothetical protein